MTRTENAAASPLPALMMPGHGKMVPTIIIDTREQTPLRFGRLPSEQAGLYSGDYSVKGLEHVFAIERKSIADLTGCLCGSGRERFERELHRLRGFRFKRLLIEGSESAVLTGRYRSNINPRAVLGSLGAFEVRYDLPVVFGGDRAACAKLIERWAWYAVREYLKTATALHAATKSGVTAP